MQRFDEAAERASEADSLVLLLVRHGRTAWNAEGRFLGRTDVPLDVVGREQASVLGSTWSARVDAVVSSPARRALETAAALGPPRVDPGLAEVAHGALEGLTLRDGRDRFPEVFRAWEVDPTAARLPGGESLGEARDRALAALARIRASHARGTIAVVSHQLTLAAVLSHVAGEPLAGWRRRALAPATTARLAWRDGWTILEEGGR